MPFARTARPALFALLVLSLGLSACDTAGPDDTTPAAPDTYTFTRDGATSVSYAGQTDRLNQVAELKAYLGTADAGATISEDALLAMFENRGGDGGGRFSFSSSKQLRDKTFGPDVAFFEGLFADAAAASATAATASNGTAGRLTRENSGATILVDARGREFTQLVEKGLMGAVFYNQIFNAYLTDAKIGDGVDNEAVAEGQNYTTLEHHWDEAFGYWAAPVDFRSDWPADRRGELQFWSKYSNVADAHLGTNGALMDAYIAGRHAIVYGDHAAKRAQRDVLYAQHELVAAAAAVHYINSTLQLIGENKTGEAFHALSEAWAFTNALRYSPRRALPLGEIEQILGTDFGADGSFWNVTPAGLNAAKARLVGAYPALAPVQDAL